MGGENFLTSWQRWHPEHPLGGNVVEVEVYLDWERETGL